VRVCVWWWGEGGGSGTNRSILRRSFTNRDTQWVAAYVWSFSDKCWGGYSSLLPTQARWAQRCTRWVRLPTLHGMQASPTSEQVVEQVRVPSKQQSSRGLGETSSQMFSTSYEDVQIEHGGSCPHLAPSHLGVSFTQVLIATQGASPPPHRLTFTRVGCRGAVRRCTVFHGRISDLLPCLSSPYTVL